MITDPHVPIWIISGWPTARESKQVHTEVAARQAEHLGEGGLTKRELDVLQLIRNPHRNKHVYRALSVVGTWLIWQPHTIPKHAMR